MSFPKFGLFYFPESNLVKVDCSDIIRGEHRRLEYVATSRNELRSEDGFVEVFLPSRSRNGPTQNMPAKILLVGGKLSIILSDNTGGEVILAFILKHCTVGG